MFAGLYTDAATNNLKQVPIEVSSVHHQREGIRRMERNICVSKLKNTYGEKSHRRIGATFILLFPYVLVVSSLLLPSENALAEKGFLGTLFDDLLSEPEGETWDELSGNLIPASQQRFVQIISGFAERYTTAENDMIKVGLRAERKTVLFKAFSSSMQFRDWVGKVHDCGKFSDDSIYVVIKLYQSEILVGTAQPGFFFAVDSHGTRITTSSPIFSNVARLKTGQMVSFSGTLCDAGIFNLLFDEDRDFLAVDTSDEYYTMTKPSFLIGLEDVQELRPTASNGFPKTPSRERTEVVRDEYAPLDTEAQFQRGNMCLEEERYSEAMKWFRMAAERGYAQAQFTLGVMYHEGLGIPQDKEEGVRWYRMAAEQGHIDAQTALEAMSDTDDNGPIASDATEATGVNAAQTATVDVETVLNVRESPSANAKVLTILSPGTDITVIEESVELSPWVLIRDPGSGVVGWVHKEYLTFGEVDSRNEEIDTMPMDAARPEMQEISGWEKWVGDGLGIWVSVTEQRLCLIEHRKVVYSTLCSTAANGVGTRMHTYQTPPGWHRIAEKIGDGEAKGRVFRACQTTREIWHPGQETSEGLVLTRILVLEGLEPGINRGRDKEGFVVDSLERHIYINGTNDEERLGEPASDGCIRLSNNDVISLFDRVPVGTPVCIDPSK